jgi:serine/threonine protein kinase/predicted negative regulator of RcsB-dependent stress response
MSSDCRPILSARVYRIQSPIRRMILVEKRIPQGVVIDARYQINELIEGEGIGSVYSATDLLSEKAVVLKVMDPDFTGDEELRKRFIREGGLTAACNGKRISPLIDSGLWQNRIPYMTMEYVDGVSLCDLIKESPGGVEPDRALKIVRLICLAISELHERGVVHRDLKPSNIKVIEDPTTPAGMEIKILDFGLARIVTDSRDTQSMTQTGMVIGTPYYMSPEQYKGFLVDTRSDIYAIGCIFYELLTGRRPFTIDNTTELMHCHVFMDPTAVHLLRPDELNEEFEVVSNRAMAKSRDDRYQLVEDMVSDLDCLLRREPVAATLPSRPKKPKASPRNEPATVLESLTHQAREFRDIRTNYKKWRRAEVLLIATAIVAPLLFMFGFARPFLENGPAQIARYTGDLRGLSDTAAASALIDRMRNGKLAREAPDELFNLCETTVRRCISKKHYAEADRLVKAYRLSVISHDAKHAWLAWYLAGDIAAANGKTMAAQAHYKNAALTTIPSLRLAAQLSLSVCESDQAAQGTYLAILTDKAHQLTPFETIVLRRRLANTMVETAEMENAEQVLKHCIEDANKSARSAEVACQVRCATLDLAEVELELSSPEVAAAMAQQILNNQESGIAERLRGNFLLGRCKELAGNSLLAERYYQDALKLAGNKVDSTGSRTSKADIYLALSRINEKSNPKMAQSYRKNAYQLSVASGDMAGMTQAAPTPEEQVLDDFSKPGGAKKDKNAPKSHWQVTGSTESVSEGPMEDATVALVQEYFDTSRKLQRSKAFVATELSKIRQRHWERAKRAEE